MNKLGMTVAGVGLALLLASNMLYVLDQKNVAVVYALGEIRDVITEPGLKTKLPAPLQNVVLLDRRIQTLESPETRPIFTAEKKSLLIDWMIKWRISDPRQFIRNNGTEIRNLETRLSPIVQAAFNEEITKRTVGQVLASQRNQIMLDVEKRLRAETQSFGIEIQDVRVKRVDFVADITDSVYRRMESERKQVANELRSEGAAQGERVRAEADRQREIIVAQAYKEAQQVMGQGDARANEIFAKAFGQDPSFARFYRSLDAYQSAFRSKSDVMVLDKDSEFFQAMKTPGGQ